MKRSASEKGQSRQRLAGKQNLKKREKPTKSNPSAKHLRTKPPKKRRASSIEVAQAEFALLSAVLELNQASTDDAHQRFELPNTVEQRAWGGITNRARADGVLRRVSDRHTKRKKAHGRRIGLWEAPDTQRVRDRLQLLKKSKRRPCQQTLFDDGEGSA